DENNSEGKQECLNITIVCNEIKNLAKPYYTWLARFFACEKLSKTGLYSFERRLSIDRLGEDGMMRRYVVNPKYNKKRR
ncbi:MAG: hypothetical protein IKO61_00705, partial [Lachnospiraceae bacterium]|nr:hypothetical protein [Lachnospiraceae bacterium]